MISKNVMSLDDIDNKSVWYKIGCSCTGDDCGVMIEMSNDPDFHILTVRFYKEIIWDSEWGLNPFYVRWWNRIKAACRIIFTGRIDLESDFVIQSEEHLNSFIEALEEGKQKIKECNNEN